MALRNIGSVLKLNELFPGRFSSLLISRGAKSKADCTPKDIETHTGQKFAEDDYRLCRFVDREKQVNPNWAIKLIAEVPAQPVKERVVWCDGGSGPTGHPKVYINLDKPGCHSCLYCGLRFYKEECHH